MLHLRKFFLGCIVMAAMMGGTSCSSYKSALYMQESEVFNETSKSQLYDFRIMPTISASCQRMSLLSLSAHPTLRLQRLSTAR